MSEKQKTVNIEKKEGIVLEILEELCKNELSDKQIANMFGMDLAFVKRIHQHYSMEINSSKNSNDKKVADISTTNKTTENTVVDKKVTKRRRVTDDMKLTVIELLEEGLTISKVQEKTGIGKSSIGRIKKEFLGTIKSPANKQDMNKTDTEIKKIEIPSKVVEVGLCADRHPMNVRKYIFSNVDEKLMFNYMQQYQIIKNFVERELCQGQELKVYTTGLNCLNASLIKYCFENNLGLMLMHYNSKMNKYIPQRIYTSTHNISSVDLYTLNAEEVYLVGADKLIDINTDHFYSIKKVSFDEKRHSKIILSNDSDGLWLHYPKFVTEIMNDNSNKIALFLNEVTVKNSVISEMALAKSFNYDNKDRKVQL